VLRTVSSSTEINGVVTTATAHSQKMSAVRLTAPGRGAVATVRLSCSTRREAVTVDAAFTAANGIVASSAPINRVLFGSWRGEDVVVVRTAEDEWEVHCHGGEAALTRILDEFSADPATIVTPASSLDQLLLQARTPKTARLLLAQSNGILRQALLNVTRAKTPATFRQQLNDLLQWESTANHLVVPWRVVIAGPPNTGKSSLLNAIAGYERSIVFDEPGTTRDAVRTELVLDGWPFCIVDTAGIRQDSDDPIERQGITHAQELFNTGDLILIAVDASVGWTVAHDDIVLRLPDHCRRAAIGCKCDLADSGDKPPGDLTWLRTSAEQGDGIRELADWIVAELVPAEPGLTTPLPVAGAADFCRVLLGRLEDGDALDLLGEELSEWMDCVFEQCATA
jgi:tRNA modification GTPase